MNKGTVKWFDDSKGYGFLRTDGCDEDIFVHYSSVQAEGFRSLTKGEEVQFELGQGDKGFKAENVTRPASQPAAS
ncbi:MAG: cold shock domain-containing protein [Planctomycetota bacterium]|nr:cold shock domain-containing protein [Planctomycetota bacterium]